MKKQIRVLLALALLVATVSLAGCPKSTTIADINADPGRFRDKEVSIQGRVVNSFGLGGEGGYELDDGTGRMWVVAGGRSVPSKGSNVRATGRVQTGLTFAGRSFGTVLRETDRHSQAPR
jgi:hypothetical protein